MGARPLAPNELAGKCAVCEWKSADGVASDGRAMCTSCAGRKGLKMTRRFPPPVAPGSKP